MRAKYHNYRPKTKQQPTDDNNAIHGLLNKLRDPLNIFTGILAISTVALTMVAWMQFRSLDQTDKTLRTGDRAFIYIDGVDISKYNDGSGDKWIFTLNAINNGGTHTKSIYFYVTCTYGAENYTTPVITSFLGPKQKVGMGSCIWPQEKVERLWVNNWSVEMTSGIFYIDVFNGSHFTRQCRRIFVRSEPKNSLVIQHEDDRCEETTDCVDNECFRASP
jgi:hypothetical protein